MKRPFPSHYTYIYRTTLLNRVSDILLYLCLVGNLNWFSQVTLPNVHLVSVARNHDPFHRSKNRTPRQTFFSKSILLLELSVMNALSTLFVCLNCKSDISKKWFLVLRHILTAMRCFATSHFGVNFRDKIASCIFFIFNVKLLLLYW